LPDNTKKNPEEQAVSGRWRALTRAHTRPSTETWQKELFQKLMSVFKVATWDTSAKNRESFEHRLPPIFKAVSELRTAMGEKFTSADLEISVFDSDTLYDSSIMDDAYSDSRLPPGGKRAPEVIFGTTGIGLMKLMAELNSKDVLQFQSVIPAKIVLKSTLNEALGPAQSSSPEVKGKKEEVADIDGANHDLDGRD
jgi:hypothetical protein